MVDEGERLSRLVENLLDVSRLESGSAEPRREPVDLAGVLRGGARVDRRRRRGGAARRSTPSCRRSRADPAQLERAFANLLENARRPRRRPAGPGPLPLVGRRLVVRVVDRARGSPRASGSGSSSPSTAREGSRPAARPRPGDRQGASSRPTAARSRSSRCPGRAAASSSPSPLPGGGGVNGRRRVLVCDDEPQILRALRVILRDAGFEAVPASTGEEALDLAAVQPPRGGDPRPDAARPRRGRGDAAAPRVERDADPRPLRGRRGGPQGRGAGGRRRRLRDQAVRPARAGRPPARRRCAAPGPRTPSRRSSSTGSRSTSPPAASAATARTST